MDGTEGVTGGSAVDWARTTLSSFGSSSDSIESSISSRIVSPVGVNGKGLSMVTLDKSK